jgi:DNA (cytosine-5)-methyltransferase 1
LNGLSICSGVGGLDAGLQRGAGIVPAAQVEIDPWCRGILEAHWPGVARHDDLRTAAAWWASAPRPAIGVLYGGIPCQPHSGAGKRLGTADPRWIWPAARDLIETARPRYVILENVPRFVRSGLLDVLSDLAALRFDAVWGHIPAAALGAPHLRWRFFLFAALADPECPGLAELRGEPGVDGPQLPPAERDRDQWGAGQPEPGLGRGPDGFPGWLDGTWEAGIPRTAPRGPDHNDRLRGIGNAVVPAVAEYAGRLFTQWIREENDHG